MADVTITVANLTDAQKVAKKMVGDEAFGLYVAAQWHRLYQDFVPMVEGDLYGNVTFAPMEITHNAGYAGYQYNGARKDGSHVIQNYSKEKHPLAGPRWDDAAVPTQGPKLEKSVENYLGRKVVVD